MKWAGLALLCGIALFGPGGAAAEAPVPRLIVLGAPAAELVCALGLRDHIVGRAAWITWPPKLAELPDVGSPATPNLERVISLRPGLVLAEAHYTDLAQKLKAWNIKVLAVNAYAVGDVIPELRRLGALFGREARAEAVAGELEGLSGAVTTALADLAPEDRPRGLMLAGGEGMLFSFARSSGRRLLEMAGAENMCADMGVPYPVLSREWLARSAPDFLLFVPEEERLRQAGRLERIRASLMEGGPLAGLSRIREGRLLVMDGPLTYGPRAFAGALLLAARLHPERFTPGEAEARIRHFYETCFHAELGGEEDMIRP